MSKKIYNVLFLCTGNSARSIMGEVLMNEMGRDRFKAYSAGSHPTGKVNPYAIETMRGMNFPVDNLRSKAWDEFAEPGAPQMDFIFTVCDSAAGEACPVWLGHPITAHWGVEDPAHIADPDEARRQFKKAALTLMRRIELFIALPLDKFDEMSLREKLKTIGKS
ncbi:MAG TPA: arsenate reductase ArsC [Burkholderiales bacterium]|nr:arsenate reductase ArsC [Burkholderiales bacterium]